MCGIVGIVGGRYRDPARIAAMLARIAHRGPDGEGVHRAGEAVLGHRRLAIIDLAGGRQPILNEDGSIVLVGNGEIYNYRELLAELEAAGHRFRTRSDNEVILHLYEQEGVDCLARLRGMFAFAIWDSRRRRLFAARDRLGQKPFYYRHAGEEFAFASEIKALLPLLEDGPEMDPRALHQYFALRIVAPPLSMIRGIAKLPPAHYLLFDRERGVRLARYWQPVYEPKETGGERRLLDRLEEALVEAVDLHLVSDVPVGAFLSGGLDSTLVLAIAARHLATGPLPTFTIGLPYGAYNEAPAARLVAERYGTVHHEEVMVPSLVAHLSELVDCLDEPSDPLAVCSWLISRMARRHVKVVLGGDGGDELFGGYDRYYGNIFAEWYAMLPAPLRRHLLGPVVARLPEGNWYKSLGHRLKWLHRASFLSGGERYARSLGYFYLTPDLQQRLYGPRLRATARDFDPYACIREAYEAAAAEHPVDRMLAADSAVRLPDHSVMILDRTSMAHGLEARSPFLDHRLAEFTATLPVRYKIRLRQLRYLQRRLAERYLPPALLARQKQGFSSALPYLLREEYRRLFAGFLRDSRLARDGFLDQRALDRLVAAQLAGTADHGNRLWLLLNAEVWYRMRILDHDRRSFEASLETASAGA